MSLSLVIAANAIADLAIVGLVTFVMSRASRLEPHLAASTAAAAPVARKRAATRPRQSLSRGTAAAAHS